MITFFLCDDNEVILEKYADDLQLISKQEQLDIAIRTFHSGEALLFELSEDPNGADVVILDVLMGKMNGIDTAKELRRLGCLAEIVYLTSSEEFFFDSFDTKPFYYLLKNDASFEKYKSTILKVYEAVSNKVRKVFRCECKDETRVIPYDEIIYFEVNDRVITVHYGDHQFAFYSTMEALCQELDCTDFIRTHSSFLVNIKHIRGVVKNGATISNGETVPVSESYAHEMRLSIMKYYSR